MARKGQRLSRLEGFGDIGVVEPESAHWVGSSAGSGVPFLTRPTGFLSLACSADAAAGSHLMGSGCSRPSESRSLDPWSSGWGDGQETATSGRF
jgi:hypothetical protein